VTFVRIPPNTSPIASSGERKQVTVLFADVKGSMELAEQLGAEAWHDLLDRFFEILADGVHRFEGTVNQYTGDGIMALFGAPIAHEDHAQRACYAALSLRDALREFAREVKRRHGLDFATRIGVNSGEVVVGKIGDDLRMDYTAQGHTVGLAQRMEALASGGSIYLSEHTAKLARLYFALEDLDEFTLKGVAEPLHVYELTGAGSARTRFDLSRARGLVRFVGREAETRTLEAALERTRRGEGQVLGIVADAGTGKSRLCFEFAERCRAEGMRVNEGHCVAHGKNLPLLPVLEVIRAYYGIENGESDALVREKVAGRLLGGLRDRRGDPPARCAATRELLLAHAYRRRAGPAGRARTQASRLRAEADQRAFRDEVDALGARGPRADASGRDPCRPGHLPARTEGARRGAHACSHRRGAAVIPGRDRSTVECPSMRGGELG